MVDITQCAVCGRTIPATLDGCAYCDRERSENVAGGEYTPMLMRWLLVLFVLTTAFSAFLAILALIGADSDALVRSALALGRLCLAAAAGIGVLRRRAWAWRAAQAFVAFEILSGAAHAFGILPADAWPVRVITPLSALLFGFFFLRSDVQAYFDRQRRNRESVEELLHSLDSAGPGANPQPPKRR